jgi:hypothetical protein
MRDFHSQLQRAEEEGGDSELFTHNPLYRRMDSDENKARFRGQQSTIKSWRNSSNHYLFDTFSRTHHLNHLLLCDALFFLPPQSKPKLALPPIVQSGNAASLDPIAKFFLSHTKHGRASIQVLCCVRSVRWAETVGAIISPTHPTNIFSMTMSFSSINTQLDIRKTYRFDRKIENFAFNAYCHVCR